MRCPHCHRRLRIPRPRKRFGYYPTKRLTRALRKLLKLKGEETFRPIDFRYLLQGKETKQQLSQSMNYLAHTGELERVRHGVYKKGACYD